MIVDLSMPNLDGFSAIDRLRKRRLFKSIPIIVLTSLENELIDELSLLDDVEIVYKPIEPLSLLQKVKSVLNRKNSFEGQLCQFKSVNVDTSTGKNSKSFLPSPSIAIKNLVNDQVFEYYRLVDLDTKETYSLSPDCKDVVNLNTKCYLLWERKSFCKDCRCAKLLNEKRSDFRVELVNNSAYLVYSQIAEFNAKQYILQLVKDISHSLIFSDHDSINYFSINELVDKAVTYSNKDPFTGLLNKTAVKNKISQVISNDDKFSIALIDIDNFKQVNDTFGHLIGDKVLLFLSNEILFFGADNFNIGGRIGGDEFVVISILDKHELDQLIIKLRSVLEKHTFKKDNNKFNVSFSYGIAEYMPNDDSSSMLERADIEMYKQKKKRKAD